MQCSYHSYHYLSSNIFIIPSCAAGVSFTFSSCAFSLKIGLFDLRVKCLLLHIPKSKINSNVWTRLQDIFNWCAERSGIANISSLPFLILNLDKCKLLTEKLHLRLIAARPGPRLVHSDNWRRQQDRQGRLQRLRCIFQRNYFSFFVLE